MKDDLGGWTIPPHPFEPGYDSYKMEHHTVSSACNESSAERPKKLSRCEAALREIENPKILRFPYPWNYKHKDSDFERVVRPWLEYRIPVWPKGTFPSPISWNDIYRKADNGPPILALICSEGIIVAIDSSVADKDHIPSSALCVYRRIRFNSRVFGFIAGEVADCELFLRRLSLPQLGKNVEEVSNWLVETQSSCNLKGLSGILIAGWDNKGPSMYHLDGEGKLHEGVLVACGSCAEFGSVVVDVMNFPFMSITEAAKLVRIAIPMTEALNEYFMSDDSGSNDSNDEASENDKIGDSVVVYCIGPNGIGEVDETGAIREVVLEVESERDEADAVAVVL